MKNLFILLCLFFLSFASLKAQDRFTVTVNINQITNVKGTVYASLTNDANSFPRAQNPVANKVMKVEEGKMSFTFEGVLGGADYAVVLFQDLNDDGKIDMNGSMPGEPCGFSNYVMMGPPIWENCSFKLDDNQDITIQLYSF